MIDYGALVYSFEDSDKVPMFGHVPTIGELKVEPAYSEEIEDSISEEEAMEREMLLRKLGSRPTAYPRAIGAGDFAGMLEDLKSARTMQAKAEALGMWSSFFSGSMRDAMEKLAEAILEGNELSVRKLVARICA